jgi:U3 small nucleolar RNA-associated protein 21
VAAPTTAGEGNQGLLEAAFEEDKEEEDSGIVAPSIDQISSDLMTLSLVPKSRWQTLLHLDLIKERNKPTEAPKLPEKAPFFLPSTSGAQVPGLKDDAEQAENDAKSRISRYDQARFEETFTSKLRAGAETNNCKYPAWIISIATVYQ